MYFETTYCDGNHHYTRIRIQILTVKILPYCITTPLRIRIQSHLCVEPEFVRELDKDLREDALAAECQNVSMSSSWLRSTTDHGHALYCLLFPCR